MTVRYCPICDIAECATHRPVAASQHADPVTNADSRQRVVVKPDAAEILAKEMQAIVAVDRWKGRDLSAAPPEKWHHLRAETRKFWIDTAARILAAINVQPDPRDAQIAALVDALDACIANIEHADMSDGVCCCGDNMDGHSNPMSCGHAPVDMGEHYAHLAIVKARAALAAVKGGDA